MEKSHPEKVLVVAILVAPAVPDDHGGEERLGTEFFRGIIVGRHHQLLNTVRTLGPRQHEAGAGGPLDDRTASKKDLR